MGSLSSISNFCKDGPQSTALKLMVGIYVLSLCEATSDEAMSKSVAYLYCTYTLRG